MAKAIPIAGLHPDDPILACSALIVKTRLGEMLNFEPFLDDVEKVYELHQMRIAAKRLRYSMEAFQRIYTDYSSFGKQFDAATNEIKALQEHLGEIHDADVLVPQLTRHLVRLLKPGFRPDKDGVPYAGVHSVDYDACEGLLTLCQTIRAERDDRYARLLADWERLQDGKFFENLHSLLADAATRPANSGATIDTAVALAGAGE